MHDLPIILINLKNLREYWFHVEDVSAMLKGWFLKLKGKTCNITIDLADITNAFRCVTNNNLVVLKLKLKLSFHGHV